MYRTKLEGIIYTKTKLKNEQREKNIATENIKLKKKKKKDNFPTTPDFPLGRPVVGSFLRALDPAEKTQLGGQARSGLVWTDRNTRVLYIRYIGQRLLQRYCLRVWQPTSLALHLPGSHGVETTTHGISFLNQR